MARTFLLPLRGVLPTPPFPQTAITLLLPPLSYVCAVFRVDKAGQALLVAVAGGLMLLAA